MHIQDMENPEKTLIGKTVSFVDGPGQNPHLKYCNDDKDARYIGVIEKIERSLWGCSALIRFQDGGVEHVYSLKTDWQNDTHFPIGAYLHQ